MTMTQWSMMTVTVGHTANGGDYTNESADVKVTITETDTPTLSIAGASVAENAGSVTFTVSLSVASSNAASSNDGDLCPMECFGQGLQRLVMITRQ